MYSLIAAGALSLLFVALPGPARAQGPARLVRSGGQDVTTPFRGSVSRVPAKRWEDAFVTGNGRLGALWFGDPSRETLVVNHCRLFLPPGNRELVPDMAPYLPEIRRITRAKGYYPATQMMDFLRQKGAQQGYLIPSIPTDPFHPGWFVHIRQQPVGAVTGYLADLLEGYFRMIESFYPECRNGKVIDYHITAPQASPVRLRVNGEVMTVTAAKA